MCHTRGYSIHYEKLSRLTLKLSLLRRSFGSTGRHGEDDLDVDDDNDEDDASGLESMDHKMVASILRGLADAADNWQHTEL